MARSIQSRLFPLAIAAAGVLGMFAAGCSENPAAPVPVPPLDSVRVTPDTLVIRVGRSAVFTGTAYDTNGAVVNGVAFNWSSNDPSRFTISVDMTGRVTGMSEGVAKVYAELGGQVDSGVVIVAPAANGWYLQVSNANGVRLNGVYFRPDGLNGWAVGDAGKILATKNGGVDWVAQVSNTGFNMNGVRFTSALRGYAVGAGGTVLRTEDGGETWTRLLTNAGETLNDVYFYDDLRGWVAGADGLILRTRNGGETWTRIQPTAYDLQGIAFVDTTHGWAVGNNGVILGTHNTGNSWFIVQPALTASNLRAVSRRSESQAWAVGDVGTAPRTTTTPDSTAWILDNIGASNQLDGVHFSSNTTGYAVGYSGTGLVLKTVNGGTSWTPQVSNTQFRLYDVYFVDNFRGWAVGANGTIIHTGTGGVD